MTRSLSVEKSFGAQRFNAKRNCLNRLASIADCNCLHNVKGDSTPPVPLLK